MGKKLQLKDLRLKSFVTRPKDVAVRGGSYYAPCIDDGSQFAGSCANTCQNSCGGTCDYSCGQYNTCNGGPC